MKNYKLVFLPKSISKPPMYTYFAALLISSVLFYRYMLPWYMMFAGLVGIISLFYFGNWFTRKWHPSKLPSRHKFEQKLFLVALLVRIVYVVLIYIVFQIVYGDSFGFENMDAAYYHGLGQMIANMIWKGNFHFVDAIVAHGRVEISDMGYGIYLGFLYAITGNSILIARLVKCILSAVTAVLIYRIAARNFGDEVGRMSGILCMLWPNFWYYCGCQLKETEMVFLTVVFAYEAETMLNSRRFSIWRMIPSLLVIAAMFTFRSPLAVVLLLALLFSVVMSSNKVVSWGKKAVVGLLAVSLAGVTMGNRIQEETRALVEENAGGMHQQNNMEWRSHRSNGNQFAKYAGAAVFAPLIFTIPFSTMVEVPTQELQQLLHGGNFAKNILSFFVILSMFMLLLSGDWRMHTLPLAIMLGYLAVLVLSNYAQSERFHMPVLCFELMFAAYGLAQCRNKERRWFNYWLCLILVANIGWAWFKLKGRGMI